MESRFDLADQLTKLFSPEEALGEMVVHMTDEEMSDLYYRVYESLLGKIEC